MLELPDGYKVTYHHIRRFKPERPGYLWSYPNEREVDPCGGQTICRIIDADTNEIVATGGTKVHPKDNYCKATGRKLSFERALENLSLRSMRDRKAATIGGIQGVPRLPESQEDLSDQLNLLYRAGIRLGLYKAADYIGLRAPGTAKAEAQRDADRLVMTARRSRKASSFRMWSDERHHFQG